VGFNQWLIPIQATLSALPWRWKTWDHAGRKDSGSREQRRSARASRRSGKLAEHPLVGTVNVAGAWMASLPRPRARKPDQSSQAMPARGFMCRERCFAITL